MPKGKMSGNAASEEAVDNVYAKAREEGHLVDRRVQAIFVIAVAALVIVAIGLVVPQHIFDEGLHNSGYYDGYSLSWFMGDLSNNFASLFAFFTGNFEEGSYTASCFITFIVVAIAGAGLAVCGSLYQTTFRNALVTPSSLGVMNGAILGMAIWVMFFFNEDVSHGLWFENATLGETSGAGMLDSLWQNYGLALCSFAGCVIVVGLVVLAVRAAGGKSSSGIMMIVVGQVIGGVLGAFVQTLRYYYVTVDPDGAQAEMLMQLQISSFYRTYTLIDVVMVSLPLIALFAFVMLFRKKLMLLTFSEMEARSMGVDPMKMRYLTVGLATLLTAIIVSFCGRVGFVGFIVPNLARRLVGPNLAYLLPASLVLGGAFVLGAYVVMNIFLGGEFSTMTGMFISIAGACVFLFTVLRGKEVRGSGE